MPLKKTVKKYFICLSLFSICIRMESIAQSCNVDSLLISSGYNHTTDTVYDIGDADGFWTVISDPDSQTSEPRPAFTIPPYSTAWSTPFPSTQWLSSYPTNSNNRNGLYEFEFTFCMNSIQNASLSLKLRADDSAAVLLNGHYIFSASTFNYLNPPTAIITDPSKFQVGQNKIRVKVGNIGAVAMGFNLYGILKANMGAFLQPSCCMPNGKIQGVKWNDLNANGIKDLEEPPLENWTITLSGASNYSATTDIYGEYYFTNIPPGNYTLSEINKSGWTQTAPVNNYTITLQSNQVIINKNFGNHVVPLPPPLPCKDCIGSFAPEPGKKYLISAWVKEENAPVTKTSYNNPQIIIEFPSVGINTNPFSAKGIIIDGWQRIEEEFTVPSGASDMNIQLNTLAGNAFFDDIRVIPLDGSAKTFVYDPVTLFLSAELDERNYCTFYEYDEEGKRIRIKKETERGIMTIQENKNSTKKK